MNTVPSRGDEGFALAAAILALVVVGALVTGGFFAATQETRISFSSQYGTEAFYAAERGINDVVGTWNATAYRQIDVGSIEVIDSTWHAGIDTASYTVRVRSLGSDLYFLESTGRVTRGPRYPAAARRTGLVVRVGTLEIEASEALMMFGGAHVTGSSLVTGHDSHHQDWNGCTIGDSKAGITARDSTKIKVDNAATVSGTPAIAEDPNMSSDDFLRFGSLTYDQIASMADIKFDGTQGTLSGLGPSLTASGACNTADIYNWGDPDDPTGACHYHFPMIHVAGDLHINSNSRGQGILLVDGDFHINGGSQFHGVVIVRGTIHPGGGTSGIWGTARAYTYGDPLNTDSKWNGTPDLQYSSCALTRALEYNSLSSRAYPLGERSWVDLSATGTLTY